MCRGDRRRGAVGAGEPRRVLLLRPRQQSRGVAGLPLMGQLLNAEGCTHPQEEPARWKVASQFANTEARLGKEAT